MNMLHIQNMTMLTCFSVTFSVYVAFIKSSYVVSGWNWKSILNLYFQICCSELAPKDQEIIFTALLQLCNSTGSFPAIISYGLQLFNSQLCSSFTAALLQLYLQPYKAMLQLYRSSVLL